MADVEHNLKEAPYLLADRDRRGYGVRCACGWRSPLMDTPEDALAEGRQHLTEAELSDPRGEPKGFLARRRARRKSPGWEERRRD